MRKSKGPAIVFRDTHDANVVRVECIDDDGACEVAQFSGPNAVGRALWFATKFYETIEVARDLRSKK